MPTKNTLLTLTFEINSNYGFLQKGGIYICILFVKTTLSLKRIARKCLWSHITTTRVDIVIVSVEYYKIITDDVFIMYSQWTMYLVARKAQLSYKNNFDGKKRSFFLNSLWKQWSSGKQCGHCTVLPFCQINRWNKLLRMYWQSNRCMKWSII